MKTLVRRQMIVVHKAELELNEARQKLNEVMIERKTHEKLREKAFEQFKEELKQVESKEIDELVSFTYNSK
jgi:flagellar FliJ protein